MPYKPPVVNHLCTIGNATATMYCTPLENFVKNIQKCYTLKIESVHLSSKDLSCEMVSCDYLYLILGLSYCDFLNSSIFLMITWQAYRTYIFNHGCLTPNTYINCGTTVKTPEILRHKCTQPSPMA